MIRAMMTCSLALAILSSPALFAQTRTVRTVTLPDGSKGIPTGSPAGFAGGKGSNPEPKGFAGGKGSNAERTAELRLVAVRFAKRKFEVTFKNVGTAPTRPETLVLVLRNTRLTASVPAIAPGQTRVVVVVIERKKLRDVIKGALAALGRAVKDLLDDVRIEVDIDINIQIGGKSETRRVNLND
jgi:hypothetical protein